MTDAVMIEDPDEVQTVRARPAHVPPTVAPAAPMIQRIREGAMLFIPGAQRSWASLIGTRWLRTNGFRVCQRAAERDGVRGQYVWIEPLELGRKKKK